MKKFVKNIILVILPFAIIVVLVNVFVDPSNIFSNGNYEKQVATILLKGHNVDNFNNCDERLLTHYVLTQINYQPDVVVMGSSRCLEVSEDFFSKKTMLNASVSHANIFDIVSLIGLLDSSKKLPSEIYIETSNVFFNPDPTDEWFSIYPYFKYSEKKMNLNISTNFKASNFITLSKKTKAIFSFEYFQESIRNIASFNNSKKSVDIGKAKPKNLGRLFDCSITYPLSYTQPDTVKAISDASIFMSKNKLPVIDYKNVLIFQKIITYLKNKGVKIYLLNLPFQQDCYSYFDNAKQIFGEINSGILQFASTNNITLLGTFDPFEAHLTRAQFYDPLHCNKQALKTVMNIVKYTAKDSLN